MKTSSQAEKTTERRPSAYVLKVVALVSFAAGLMLGIFKEPEYILMLLEKVVLALLA